MHRNVGMALPHPTVATIMKIEFRLVDFHQQTGSLQVVYYNDDIPQGINFSLNVPIVNGAYLQGEALEEFIQGYAPVDVFERAALIRESNLQSPVENLALQTEARPPSNPTILNDRQLFVVEDNQRVLFVRPLVQVTALDIPVEVI